MPPARPPPAIPFVARSTALEYDGFGCGCAGRAELRLRPPTTGVDELRRLRPAVCRRRPAAALSAAFIASTSAASSVNGSSVNGTRVNVNGTAVNGTSVVGSAAAAQHLERAHASGAPALVCALAGGGACIERELSSSNASAAQSETAPPPPPSPASVQSTPPTGRVCRATAPLSGTQCERVDAAEQPRARQLATREGEGGGVADEAEEEEEEEEEVSGLPYCDALEWEPSLFTPDPDLTLTPTR